MPHSKRGNDADQLYGTRSLHDGIPPTATENTDTSSIRQALPYKIPATSEKMNVNTPLAKTGDFEFGLKAGLISHAAEPHSNSVLFLNYSARTTFSHNFSTQPNTLPTTLE